MRNERSWVIAATAVGALAFAAQWWGVHPVALTALTLATWLSVAIRRWGPGLGTATVVIGWMSLILATLTVTPFLGIDPAIAVGTVLVLALGATIPLVAAVPPAADRAGVGRAVLASLSGAVLWALGLAWGLLAPHGGGLSWAMYNDSTGAVSLIRLTIQDGGVTSLPHTDDPIPLAYALSASLLPPGTVVADASPGSVGAQLSAHALQWGVMIALASLLSGLVVVALGSRDTGRGWSILAGAAGASTVLLLAPLDGRLLDLGQSNAHLIIVLVAASVLAASDAHRHLALSQSVLMAAAGLLVVTWMPFATVPALLALLVDRRIKRAHLDSRRVIAWQIPGFAVAAWTFVVYGRSMLAAFVRTDPDLNYSTRQTYSRPGYWEKVGNPYWWPLSIGLVLIAIVLLVLVARRTQSMAWLAGLSVAGLVIGMVPFFALTRRIPVPLEYFPAKYLSIATICLIPIVTGAALRVLAERKGVATRGAIAACVAVACGLAIAAPLPSGTSRWGFTPYLIARGEHYGTGDQVAGRIVDFASNDTLVLPWRYDPPFDTAVGMMNSAFGPNVANAFLIPQNRVLRNFRNDFSAEVACMLPEASLRPVVLITSDPGLQGEVDRQCPGTNMTIRLEPAPTR